MAASTTRRAFGRLAELLSYVDGDYTDQRHVQEPAPDARERATPGALPRDPAEPVPDRRGGARLVGLRDERPRHRREAVRARPEDGAGAQRGPPLGLPGAEHLPDRPLPRQGGDPEHPLLPVRELVPRADLEPQLRPPGADHDGRGLRRGGPREVLRGGRRAARRRAEPPAPDPRAPRDGAAGRLHRRRSARREGEGVRRGPHAPRRRPRPRSVRRLPRRGRCRARLRRRDVRGRPVLHRLVALGRACPGTSAPARTSRSRARRCASSCTAHRSGSSPSTRISRATPTTCASASTRRCRSRSAPGRRRRARASSASRSSWRSPTTTPTR